MFQNRRFFHSWISSFTAFACAGILFLEAGLSVHAASKTELALENNRALPIQSNETPNWPTGPVGRRVCYFNGTGDRRHSL